MKGMCNHGTSVPAFSASASCLQCPTVRPLIAMITSMESGWSCRVRSSLRSALLEKSIWLVRADVRTCVCVCSVEGLAVYFVDTSVSSPVSTNALCGWTNILSQTRFIPIMSIYLDVISEVEALEWTLDDSTKNAGY